MNSDPLEYNDSNNQGTQGAAQDDGLCHNKCGQDDTLCLMSFVFSTKPEDCFGSFKNEVHNKAR